MKVCTHRIPGLVLTSHEFMVPLDYGRPDDGGIVVFAREVVSPGRENDDLPWLIFFQGGPGFGAPRPNNATGWLKRALQDYRVLLLDQRGTGRSTPITFQTMAGFTFPQAQAAYLKHFRADNIVKDAEFIRHQLCGKETAWSALGQSYGGFCITHYLSAAPEGLREVFFTGGLPPICQSIDQVYQATYQRVIDKNAAYCDRYPDDMELAQLIVTYLAKNDVHLPSGDRLSPQRFQQLGLAFGGTGGFEQVHYLLEEAFVPGSSGPELSYGFLRHFENAFAFQT
ncbi:MAG: alpha/beta fold hydrolase, partial [Chloroflexota bacterium]